MPHLKMKQDGVDVTFFLPADAGSDTVAYYADLGFEECTADEAEAILAKQEAASNTAATPVEATPTPSKEK